MYRPSILVVEDEQLVALDIQRRLLPICDSVATAATGAEAIQRAKQSRPDLVLMDIKLNGMDGIDAARRIRDFLDVPIVYLTAYADEATLERARASEPYGYILKPFDERELKATIDMAIERHRGDRYRREQDELQRFLADASVRLSESLDYQTVVGRAAQLIVPRHADWCFIRLQPFDDVLRPLEVTHPVDEREAPSEHPEPGSVVAQVLQTGDAQLHAAIPDPRARSEMLGPDHVQMLEKLELVPRSLICAPLIARERTLGAILLVSAGARLYGRSDLALTEDFAHRLSMAIDNAMLYREARRATRLREEVLAIVSHDLRNPLAAILMRAEALEAGAALPGTARAIVRSARQIDRMVSDLLDAASIEAGRLSLERSICSAASLVREAVDSLRPVAEQRSIVIHDEALDEAIHCSCDRGRLLQVFSNLIGNAIKFTPKDGSISVHVERRGAQVHFSISDTGSGIPAEQLPHLFERFWSAHPRRDGVGLGLYIARGIVEAHGGTISVESDRERGSVFHVTIPVAPPR